MNGVITFECPVDSLKNAPVIQINDDFYEDLTVKKVAEILDSLRKNGKTQ